MALSNTATPIEYGKFRDAVLAGEIPVCQEISQYMNLVDDLIASPEFYYDDSAINGFIAFCENEMTLTDGSDITLLPSFRLWAEDLLAWFYYAEENVYNPETRRMERAVVKRRLRNKQYLIVGRGAAKSLYSSMLQAYWLIMDTQTTHQVVTAPTMIQAEETMQPIRTALTRARGPLFKFLTQGNVMTNDPYYKVKLASTKKGIQNFVTNSIIEVRTMSIDKLQGMRSKYNSVDEWLSGKTKEDVIGAIEQGASKNNDWAIVATSSEGTSRNGVGDTIKMELLDILNGTTYNPHISIWYYRLDDIKEISTPFLWTKANPNIGVTTSHKSYEDDVRTAETVPAKRNDILAKRFGIPVEGLTYFFTYDETIPHRKQKFDGMMCSVGADLSQGDDFCAFTLMFPSDDGEIIGAKVRSYVSEAKVNRLTQAMRVKYDEFVREGTLVVVPGKILDMNIVYDDLMEWIEEHEYEPITLGYDPYNSKEFLARWTADFSEFGVVKVIQGAKTESVPLGELKNLAESRLILFDEELMKFSMGNAIAVEDTNGNLKLSKRRASEKIDNVAALMDAWVAYKLHKEAF